jgi:hypothetical protein
MRGIKMKKLTIYLDDEEVKVLEKRAKKNIFTLKEQVEDIIRTSVVRTKTTKRVSGPKVDDRLVSVFSRQKTGPKKKKKVKKKK